MEGMLQCFRDLSIRKKILFMYLAVMILPLFLLGYFSNRISTNMIIQKSLKNSSENLLLISRNLDSLTESLKYYATNLTMMINSDLDNENLADADIIDELGIQSRIERTFNYIIYSYPNISSGMFISTTGGIYGKEYRPKESDREIIGSGIIKAIQDSDGGLIWFDMQKRDYLNVKNLDRNKYVLTVGKKIFNTNNGKVLGSLVLNVTEESIASIYKGLKLGDTGKYCIMNNDGIIVSSLSKEDILTHIDSKVYELWKNNETGGKVTTINGKRILTVCSAYPKLNWKLIGVVPLEELTGENTKITMVIFSIGIVCFFLLTAASVLLSRVISIPIRQLTDFTSNVTRGDLNLQFPVKSKDEVGQLGEGLNYMILRIKRLLNEVVEEQRQKRSYELKLIQSQIKPHFLYNALELISSLAKLNMVDEVVKTVESLSTFYRIALSKGSDIISVEKEVQNAVSYLEIVKTLYIDIIDYEIDFSNETYCYQIPKLTIQPIVENAVYHGLKSMNKKGLIKIEGFTDKDILNIKISDNGAGMTQDTINNIMDGKYEGSNKSFGLKSVDDRIKLCYGDSYGINIKSSPGCGTTIGITIPAVKGAEKHD